MRSGELSSCCPLLLLLLLLLRTLRIEAARVKFEVNHLVHRLVPRGILREANATASVRKSRTNRFQVCEERRRSAWQLGRVFWLIAQRGVEREVISK